MASLSFNIIFLAVLAILSFMTGTSVGAPTVPAIFVFGDSLADVGNNNYLNISVTLKSNFLYYGIDIPSRVPTGRFSNGYNGIDYIAQNLGFKASPPAYLSINKTNQILQGVSFASAGSGILVTTNNGTLNMATQVKYFESTVRNLKAKMGAMLAKDHVAKSLYILVTASNDMFHYYAATGAANSTANSQFISDLVDEYIGQIMTIYDFGARKFAITGTGLLGCVPYFRNRVPSTGCVEALNQLSVQFNIATKKRIQQLSKQLVGFKYSFSDSYNAVSTIVKNASTYGFKELENACCGVGKFNGLDQCNTNATYCSARNGYLFWDWFHPTQALYNLTSHFSLYGSTSFVVPINVRQLAQSC